MKQYLNNFEQTDCGTVSNQHMLVTDENSLALGEMVNMNTRGTGRQIATKSGNFLYRTFHGQRCTI